MSIATRKGDDGTTTLLYGDRVPKDHPQIEAVGAFDELNVALGAIKPLLGESAAHTELRELIVATQKNLIALMGEVSCAEADAERHANSKFKRITAADVEKLDGVVAQLEARGLKFDGWATPGANALSAGFESARATARRAERRLAALPSHGRTIRPEVRQYVNRLSDALWLLARAAEQ